RQCLSKGFRRPGRKQHDSTNQEGSDLLQHVFLQRLRANKLLQGALLSRVHPPESPRTFTTNETRRKASSPATALTPTVTRNSMLPAESFGAIIGRASIIRS